MINKNILAIDIINNISLGQKVDYVDTNTLVITPNKYNTTGDLNTYLIIFDTPQKQYPMAVTTQLLYDNTCMVESIYIL